LMILRVQIQRGARIINNQNGMAVRLESEKIVSMLSPVVFNQRLCFSG
jgi:hypothetical protein